MQLGLPGSRYEVNMALKESLWFYLNVYILVFVVSAFAPCCGWIHHLELQNDERRSIPLMHDFGLGKDGTMAVNLTAFSFTPSNILDQTHSFGFILGKRAKAMMADTASNLGRKGFDSSKTLQYLNLTFDLTNMKVVITRIGQDLKYLIVSRLPHTTYLSNNRLSHAIYPRAQPPTVLETNQPRFELGPEVTSLDIIRRYEGPMNVYQTYFLIHVKDEREDGLYSLNFLNCANDYPGIKVNLSLTIVQDNNGNYLSADQTALPAVYFVLSVVFFSLAISWLTMLRKATEDVHKIHNLMLITVFFKSLNCLFHGVHLYMMQKSGIHVDVWAIVYVCSELIQRSLTFITILLLGIGWKVIKQTFLVKDKFLFLASAPVQILASVAWVITEKSEEAYANYATWRSVFIGADILCCFILLFPTVCSIKLLGKAPKTIMNLAKLKLFRHFYFLIVVYIYASRIFKYFLTITLPYPFGWVPDVFSEVILLIFFIVIGYKFRPVSDKLYKSQPTSVSPRYAWVPGVQDETEEENGSELEEVLTRTGSTEHLVGGS